MSKINLGGASEGLGAAAGAAGMIPGFGTIASAGLGALSFITGLIDKNKQKKAQEEEQKQKELELKAAQAYKNMTRENVAQTPNAPLFAAGGSLEQIIGNKHTQGGTMYRGAELEKGEMVMDKNFVFSDRVKPPKSKRTYAQIAESIKKKYKNKKEDPVEAEQMQRELNELYTQQELQKIQEGIQQIPTGKNNTAPKMGGGGPIDLMKLLKLGLDPDYFVNNPSELPATYDPNNSAEFIPSVIGNIQKPTKLTIEESNQSMNQANTEPNKSNDWLTGLFSDNKEENELFGRKATNWANIFNLARGAAGFFNYNEDLQGIDYDEVMPEQTSVDFDLINPQREIAEAQKVFGSNAYSIAQNAQGAGNYLTNMAVNAANSAENVSDVVHRVNKANVEIANEQEKINAEAQLQDSDNLLRAKIYNADIANQEKLLEGQNRASALNLIDRALQGISQQNNVKNLDNNKRKVLGIYKQFLDDDTLPDEERAEIMTAINQLIGLNI